MIDRQLLVELDRIAFRIRHLEVGIYRGIGLDTTLKVRRELEYQKAKEIILKNTSFTNFIFNNLKNIRYGSTD